MESNKHLLLSALAFTALGLPTALALPAARVADVEDDSPWGPMKSMKELTAADLEWRDFELEAQKALKARRAEYENLERLGKEKNERVGKDTVARSLTKEEDRAQAIKPSLKAALAALRPKDDDDRSPKEVMNAEREKARKAKQQIREAITENQGGTTETMHAKMQELGEAIKQKKAAKKEAMRAKKQDIMAAISGGNAEKHDTKDSIKKDEASPSSSQLAIQNFRKDPDTLHLKEEAIRKQGESDKRSLSELISSDQAKSQAKSKEMMSKSVLKQLISKHEAHEVDEAPKQRESVREALGPSAASLLSKPNSRATTSSTSSSDSSIGDTSPIKAVTNSIKSRSSSDASSDTKRIDKDVTPSSITSDALADAKKPSQVVTPPSSSLGKLLEKLIPNKPVTPPSSSLGKLLEKPSPNKPVTKSIMSSSSSGTLVDTKLNKDVTKSSTSSDPLADMTRKEGEEATLIKKLMAKIKALEGRDSTKEGHIHKHHRKHRKHRKHRMTFRQRLANRKKQRAARRVKRRARKQLRRQKKAARKESSFRGQQMRHAERREERQEFRAQLKTIKENKQMLKDQVKSGVITRKEAKQQLKVLKAEKKELKSGHLKTKGSNLKKSIKARARQSRLARLFRKFQKKARARARARAEKARLLKAKGKGLKNKLKNKLGFKDDDDKTAVSKSKKFKMTRKEKKAEKKEWRADRKKAEKEIKALRKAAKEATREAKADPGNKEKQELALKDGIVVVGRRQQFDKTKLEHDTRTGSPIRVAKDKARLAKLKTKEEKLETKLAGLEGKTAPDSDKTTVSNSGSSKDGSKASSKAVSEGKRDLRDNDDKAGVSKSKKDAIAKIRKDEGNPERNLGKLVGTNPSNSIKTTAPGSDASKVAPQAAPTTDPKPDSKADAKALPKLVKRDF